MKDTIIDADGLEIDESIKTKQKPTSEMYLGHGMSFHSDNDCKLSISVPS